MQHETIRLYSYALSPFAAKVHCFLAYMGLEFVPVTFRLMLAVGRPWRDRIRNRRRGARVLAATVPVGVPLPLRVVYPFVIARPAFIQRLIRATDTSRGNRELVRVLIAQLVAYLSGAPFLGGRNEASLADLAAYAQLALPYLAGYDDATEFTRNPTAVAWFTRVGELVSAGRPLLPRTLCERSLPVVVCASRP